MTVPAPELAKTRDVSVIIPSNLDQRLDWLKHRLNFLYRHGYQGEAIVGVWGGHDQITALQSFCAPLSPKIRVIPQDGAILFTSRVLKMAEQTDGKYIVQIGDDDFLLPDALENLVSLLEQDSSVFCAQGRTISIYDDFTGPIFKLDTLAMWPAPEVNLLTRYTRYLTHPGKLFHAMFRRADFVERFKWMDETMTHTRNQIWFEAMGDFFAIIKGRFVILDDIFMLRGKHTTNTSRILLRDSGDEMFPFFLLSEKFSPTYKFFEGQIFQLLSSLGVDVTEPETRKIILTGILNLLGAILYGRRGPPPQEEVDLKAILSQTPLHPRVARILNMLVDTKIACQ